MNNPFTYRQRGEPAPKWLEDDSAEFQNKSLEDIIESLRKAREIMKESNDKALLQAEKMRICVKNATDDLEAE